MNRIPRKIFLFAIIGIALSTPVRANGYAVFDSLLLSAVTAMNSSVSALLYNIGLAVNQNGQKIASAIEASAKTQREFEVMQDKNRRLEDARQRYVVPSHICSESGSGGVGQIVATASAEKGNIRPGGSGGISNAMIAKAINSPPPAPEIDASRAAKIHAQFCDADDYAAYGGARACPSISTTMPGADKRIDTILSGAGTNGKNHDLTFSQAQADAARMYVQNSIRRSIAPQLRKGEADTIAGTQYIGLMNQYSAIISAAADPQEQRIADSQPNHETKNLLKEMLSSPSAGAYYHLFASKQARSNGVMSSREFEAFEVGRRYANTEYQADLQSMSGDNLLREHIRIASLNNWLLLNLKNDIQKNNIINGQILASMARQEYAPLLTEKYRAVSGSIGGVNGQAR